MKKLTLLAVTMLILMVCRAAEPPAPGAAGNAPEGDEARRKPLFLHLLEPGGNGAAARRIASTRVYLFQEFSVSLGDLDNPFTNHWDGAVTFPRIGTNGVFEARPLGSTWDSGDAVLAGHVDARFGEFFAKLQGRTQTTLNYFDGEIELEKPVEQHGCRYRGVIRGVWFVLSENPDCGGFLRHLNHGALCSPSVVASDSPEVKRWLEQNASKSPGSTKP